MFYVSLCLIYVLCLFMFYISDSTKTIVLCLFISTRGVFQLLVDILETYGIIDLILKYS